MVVIYDGTRILPEPFLDIRGLVLNGGERGLLSIAFHPRYAENGLFYANYTNLQGDTGLSSPCATGSSVMDGSAWATTAARISARKVMTFRDMQMPRHCVIDHAPPEPAIRVRFPLCNSRGRTKRLSHSARNAVIGSTRAARSAGRRHPASTVRKQSADATANVTGSIGRIPASSAPMLRAAR